MENNFLNVRSLGADFFDDEGIRLSKLFVLLFKTIPNIKEANCRLKTKKLFAHLYDEFNLKDNPGLFRICDDYSVKKNKNGRIKKKRHSILGFTYQIIISPGLMFEFSSADYKILYDNTISEEKLNTLEQKIHDFVKIKKKNKKHFYMVVHEYNSLDLKQFKIKPSEVDMHLHYNDDFKVFDEHVQMFLSQSAKSGLILMHGIAGSGKTSYIRYLINALDEKFIFLPLYMAETLSSPDFLPFLTEHKNSILIIEDAEKLLKSRENEGTHNGIANLLNMSDGLLSDALGIKIICTFNTGLEKIDSALLRKGRMISRYEFKELSPGKAKVLSEKENLNYKGDKPITLGDLYHANTINQIGDFEGKRVGF